MVRRSGTGVQSASVQALYLDDEMSGWEVYENRFINCQAGTFIGGGRDNSFHDNYCELGATPLLVRSHELGSDAHIVFGAQMRTATRHIISTTGV